MYRQKFGTFLVAITFALILAKCEGGTRSRRGIGSIVSQLLFGDEVPETMQMQTITKTATAVNDGTKVINQQVKFALRGTPESENNNNQNNNYKGYGFQNAKLPTHDMTTAKPQSWLNLPIPFLSLSYEKIEEPEPEAMDTKSQFPLITDYKPQSYQNQGSSSSSISSSNSYQKNRDKDFDDIDGLRPPTFSDNNFVSYEPQKPIINDNHHHMSYDPPRHRPRPHHRPQHRPRGRRPSKSKSRRRRRRRKNGRPKRRRQHKYGNRRRVAMDHPEVPMMMHNPDFSGGRRRSLQL